MTTYTPARRAYYQRHKQRVLQRNKLYVQNHYQKIRAYNRQYQKSWARTPKGRFANAIVRARLKHVEWNLTFETYRLFLSRPCHYCHGPLNSSGVGLDRIQPKLGYVENNVVPCCKTCNEMKSDKLTHDEMQLIWTRRHSTILTPVLSGAKG